MWKIVCGSVIYGMMQTGAPKALGCVASPFYMNIILNNQLFLATRIRLGLFLAFELAENVNYAMFISSPGLRI